MNDTRTSIEEQIKSYIRDAQGVREDNSDLREYEKGYLRGLKVAQNIVRKSAENAIIADILKQKDPDRKPTDRPVSDMTIEEKAKEICDILDLDTRAYHLLINTGGFTAKGLSAVLQNLREQNNEASDDEL